MAFNKRTWKGRQGTGLNKFSIDGATPVTVVNQPDSITEQGDALSAGNLNDLENRINNAFEEIADGTQVVGKATADASGNVITDTYETKAEASDLNDALTQLDHRVENLEQAKGDYVVSNYKDGSITPSGKGNWAIVEGLRGVSRVENQLMQSWNFSTQYPWSRNSGTTTLTVANNKAIVTHDSAPSVSYDGGILASHYPMKVISGHTYLVCYGIKTSVACSMTAYFEGCGYFTAGAISANTQSKYMALKTATSSVDEVNLILLPNNAMVFGAGDTEEYSEVIIRDLNVYFGGTIPSDADTIAEIQTNYPHLLTPSEYGTRIVDSSYSGVRAWGVNLFNPYAQQMTIYASAVISDNGDTITVTGTYYCQFDLELPMGSYYVRWREGSGSVHRFRFMFEDGTFTDAFDNNKSYTATQKITGLMLYCASSSPMTSVYYDLQVCSDDFSDKTTYHRYREPSTLTLTFQGKSAGSVYDQLETNAEIVQEIDGEKVTIYKKRTTERIGTIVYDGSDDEDWISSVGGRFYIALHSLIKVQNYIGYILPSRLSIVGNNLDMTDVDNCITAFKDSGTPAYPNQNWLYVRINSTITSVALLKAWLAQNPITVNYALAEESVTLSDPVLDNTLLTEAGGRMSTVQTGTVVDGSFDMGFITL